MNLLLGTWTLAWREVVRFYRQKSRVIGALVTPLLFWAVIGSGIGTRYQSSWTPSGRGYLEYFFPGVLLMTLLFTSVFSTISIIEDRREGFMQGVIVSPLSRWGIVLGKVLGTAIFSVAQGLLLLVFLPFLGMRLDVVHFIQVAGVFAFISVGLTGLGFLAAWRFNSVQGYHSIMNMVLFPMWLLSGAVFPVASVPLWMKWLVSVNPLTYGLALLRNTLYPNGLRDVALPSTAFSALYVSVFTLLVLGCSVVEVNRKTSKPKP